MAHIDDLIDELFPDKAGASANTNIARGKAPPPLPPASQSSWDSDNDACEGRPAPAHPPNAAPQQRHKVSASHGFDDSSDDEEGGGTRPAATDVGGSPGGSAPAGGATAQRSLYAVPFPQAPAGSSGFVCSQRCFVTNKGAPSAPHPPVAELPRVAAGAFDGSSTVRQMMARKGAFHVSAPAVGNGALDCRGDAGEPGGCPHLKCRKCHYTVVRLQGAAWRDEGGALDLYLTTRNFYPDWSRLASSAPVGAPDGARVPERVLAAEEGAAAYCCQCSWLTVRADKLRIDTRLTDATPFLSTEQSCPFATALPPALGETRRPPLWVCTGHTC